MPNTKSPIITVSQLKKQFNLGTQTIEVLHGIDFEIYSGDFTVILGPSGCGKSTLLHVMLGLEIPTEGKVTYLDFDLYTNTTEDQRSDFRKKHVGMVYQQSNWIKSLTVAENVAFPLLLLGHDVDLARQQAIEMITKVGLGEWADYIPTELSGGQQQRIAVARALINNPEVIIADEPTGNLDFESGKELMNLLKGLNETEDKTIIMVTHDLDYVKYSNRAIKLFDGNVDEIIDDVQSSAWVEQLRSKRSVLHSDEKTEDTETTPNTSDTAKEPKTSDNLETEPEVKTEPEVRTAPSVTVEELS